MVSFNPRVSLSLAVFLLFCLMQATVATIIATFSDDKCQDSLNSVPASNGYPNGTCTELRAITTSFGSFQVVSEDAGCAVTLYGNNTIPGDTCSANVLAIAQIATCYNSSWIYFSVDECTPPQSSQPSSTATTLVTAVSTTSPSSATATATSSGNSNSNSSTNAGAIAGGVVGGVVGLALVVVLAWFLFTRVNRSNKQQQGNDDNNIPPPVPPSELVGAEQDKKLESKFHRRPAQELSTSETGAALEKGVDRDGHRKNTPMSELP